MRGKELYYLESITTKTVQHIINGSTVIQQQYNIKLATIAPES